MVVCHNKTCGGSKLRKLQIPKAKCLIDEQVTSAQSPSATQIAGFALVKHFGINLEHANGKTSTTERYAAYGEIEKPTLSGSALLAVRGI